MTAIAATFSDFRIVRGRKVAQLIFETPLEAADEALKTLGGLPRPDAERWVGIAPLAAGAPERPAPPPGPGRSGDRRPFHTLPRSQQAAIRCQDERFLAWLWPGPGPYMAGHAEWAAGRVREQCGVRSRSELDTDEAAGRRWDLLDGRYRRHAGLEPEERP